MEKDYQQKLGEIIERFNQIKQDADVEPDEQSQKER